MNLNLFIFNTFSFIIFQANISLFQIPRNTETPPQHGSSSPRLEGKKTIHRQPSENNASKAYRGGDALQTAEIHAPRQVSKDHLIILPRNRVETIDRHPLDLSSREGEQQGRVCLCGDRGTGNRGLVTRKNTLVIVNWATIDLVWRGTPNRDRSSSRFWDKRTVEEDDEHPWREWIVCVCVCVWSNEFWR